MKKFQYILFYVSIFISIIGILSPTLADDNIVGIGFRDHYEITCRNDGLLDFHHVLMSTANTSQNVTFVGDYSYTGELASGVICKADPEIHNYSIISGAKGSSKFQVNYYATLKPHKFTKVELDYTWEGLLKKDDEGYYNFETTFNSPPKFIPEILLKIPRPTQFHRLEIAKCMPPPQVFMEETQYYILAWTTKSFDFEDATSTHIDLKYKTIQDYGEMKLWVALVIAGVLIGWFLEKIIEHLIVPIFKYACTQARRYLKQYTLTKTEKMSYKKTY